MIIRERNVHHWTSLDALAHHHSTWRDVVHAQDGTLWRVDDGGGQHGAVHAPIADGKGAASHVINGYAAITCLAAQSADCLQGLRHMMLGECWVRFRVLITELLRREQQTNRRAAYVRYSQGTKQAGVHVCGERTARRHALPCLG